MWAGRRDEAFRRAVELAETAEAVRAEAWAARQIAARVDTDDDSRASLEESAEGYDEAAASYQRTADTYVDIVFNSPSIRQDQDDDGDGYW